MKEIALVYIVAGISSRFGGRIKQFAQVGPDGETLMECSLNQAISAGFSKIIFVVGNMTETPFKEKFGNSYQGIPVLYAYQRYDPAARDRPWGTGDALCSIKDIIDCPFVVCNGDDLYGENTFKALVQHAQESDDEATIAYKLIDVLSEHGGVSRAIFQVENGYIKKMVENYNIIRSDFIDGKRSNDDLSSQNIFLLHPETVRLLAENCEKFKEANAGDRKIEFLLSNELSKLIESNKIKMRFYSTPDKWIGITNPEDEVAVRNSLSTKHI